jgi:hypothetical protein
VNTIDLIKQWEAEENYAFQGWDFSHIAGLFSKNTY